MESEFNLQIRRLESQWPSAYMAERKVVIFRAFKSCAPEQFEGAVTACLEKCRQAPLVPELAEAIETQREARALQPNFPDIHQNFPDSNCMDCGGNGYTFRADALGYRFLYRCNCNAGSRRPRTAFGPTKMDGQRDEVQIIAVGSVRNASGRDRAAGRDE